MASEAEAAEAVEAWNAAAAASGMLPCQAIGSRIGPLRRRLAELGLDRWREACGRAAQSAFLAGGNARGFRAGIDLLISAATFERLVEGAYDDRPGTGPPAESWCGPSPEMLEAMRRAELDRTEVAR